jgi:hypothetical protein
MYQGTDTDPYAADFLASDLQIMDSILQDNFDFDNINMDLTTFNEPDYLDFVADLNSNDLEGAIDHGLGMENLSVGSKKLRIDPDINQPTSLRKISSAGHLSSLSSSNLLEMNLLQRYPNDVNDTRLKHEDTQSVYSNSTYTQSDTLNSSNHSECFDLNWSTHSEGYNIGSSARKCQRAGCTKCAQGSTKFCIAHGGGRRCIVEGCNRGARDKSFCAAHGGGKRCVVEGCTKSAVGGSKLCTGHGGGKRCQHQGCMKSAQSNTMFCVRHGGGRKCSYEGCTRVARGKTSFCAGHGDHVLCIVQDCKFQAIPRGGGFCRVHMFGGDESISKKKSSEDDLDFTHRRNDDVEI